MWWLLVPLVYWLIGYLLLGTFRKMIIICHGKSPCKEFKVSSCWNYHNDQKAVENHPNSSELKSVIISYCASQNAVREARLWPIKLFVYLSKSKVSKVSNSFYDAQMEVIRLKNERLQEEKKLSSIIEELRTDGLDNLTPEKFDVMMNELDPNMKE